MQDHIGLVLVALASASIIVRGVSVEHLLGSFLLATLLLYIVYRDIIRYQPHYFRKRRMLLLLAVMVLFTLGVSKVMEVVLEGMVRGFEVDVGNTVRFGIPIAAGAMLIMLLFDFHTAIVSSVVLSLLAGLWHGEPSYTIYVFVGCLTAAFTIIGCR